jgi:hypothetical protein
MTQVETGLRATGRGAVRAFTMDSAVLGLGASGLWATGGAVRAFTMDSAVLWLGASGLWATGGAVRVFRQKFTPDDAIGSRTCSREALACSDQSHLSQVFTLLTGWHCKLRPNTEEMR